MEEKRKRLPLIPHIYTAIACWLILLALYLWTKDAAILKMTEAMFVVVIVAHQDGFKRISDSVQRCKPEAKKGEND